MFIHKCPVVFVVGQVNAAGILPEGIKVERKLKPDECCQQCDDHDKETSNHDSR